MLTSRLGWSILLTSMSKYAAKWGKFCDYVHRFTYNNESSYEMMLTVAFGMAFGWETSNQDTIPIGNHRNIRLDIALKSGNNIKIIVEVKSPDVKIGGDEVLQLGSYLKQAGVKFGLLIGNKVSLVYNDFRHSDGPIKLIDIPFDADNRDGLRLASLIDCENFGNGRELEQYCKELIGRMNIERDAKRLTKFLLSDEGRIAVLSALQNSDLTNKYNARSIDLAFSRVKIVLNDETTPITSTSVDAMVKTNATLSLTSAGKSLRTSFALLNIPVGAKLRTTFDDKEYVVHDETNKVVSPEGVINAPSYFAKRALGGARNGYDYFTYNGVKLSDICRSVDENYLNSDKNVD